MAASVDHFNSAFKNCCLVRPRKPETQLPMTDQESLTYNDDGHQPISSPSESEKALEVTRMREEKEKGKSILKNKTRKEEMYEINELPPHLLKSDDKFYKHLHELRQENKKTLKMLEKLYKRGTENEEQSFYSKNSTDLVRKMKYDEEYDNRDKFIKGVYEDIANGSQESDVSGNDDNDLAAQDYGFNTFHSANYEGSPSYQSSEDAEEDPRKEWPRTYTQNVLPDESADHFRGRPFSYEVIDNMWDGFSVDSYEPPGQAPKVKDKKSDKREWSHSITIPEPFQMTLRTTDNAKIKSKRKEKLEQELMQKKLAEEAELNKKFRARPAPATTFMQLYKENEAREEEKRQYRRSLNKAILEATQKPFEFIKREEAKKELRRSQSIEALNSEQQKGTQFKATPFPNELFNLSLEDKLAEQEEYRKIKIKMRSQEILASSSLPPNMHARGERYSINNRYKKGKQRNKLAKKETFRPRINHEIPDYEELHRKFENELSRKRQQATPTVCEPFDLHTGKVPSRSRRKSQYLSNESLDDKSSGLLRKSAEKKSYVKKDYHSSTPASRKSIIESQLNEPPPFGLTETARRRHTKAQEALSNRVKGEEEERKQTQQKKRREEQLRRRVAKKSAANDMKHIMKQQSKEKLQSFRETDIARAREYKQYLKEIKAKVEERPLLFEQESQTNAKRTAQRRYKQILQEAGVEGDVVDSLVTENGQIIGAESEDEAGDLVSYDNEYQHSSLLQDGTYSDVENGKIGEEANTDGVLNTTHSISAEDNSDLDRSF